MGNLEFELGTTLPLQDSPLSRKKEKKKSCNPYFSHNFSGFMGREGLPNFRIQLFEPVGHLVKMSNELPPVGKEETQNIPQLGKMRKKSSLGSMERQLPRSVNERT